jgi:ribosomal protein L32
MAHQIECVKCGKKASEGENEEHAEKLARAEGFTFRHSVAIKGTVPVCDECGSAKAMNVTDTEYYNEKGVKKV